MAYARKLGNHFVLNGMILSVLATVLIGCGGGGDTSTTTAEPAPAPIAPPAPPPPPVAITGVATPDSVAVVTATNAG